MNEQPANNVENQEPAPAGSGGEGTGQNSMDPGDARTAKRTRTSLPLVERVTALRDRALNPLRNQREHSVARLKRTSMAGMPKCRT